MADKNVVGDERAENFYQHSLKLLNKSKIPYMVEATIRGEPPEIYPYLGNSRLAETIDRFENVRAVFHGHSHHGKTVGETLKKIPVYNCALEILLKQTPPKKYVLFELA